MKTNVEFKFLIHLFKGSDTILALCDLTESVQYDWGYQKY